MKAHSVISPERLRESPRSVLDGLCSSPPGLYWLEAESALFVTDPDAVSTVLTSSAFEKNAATLRYRYALGDGTATSGFRPDDTASYAPLRSMHAFRRQKRTWLVPGFRARLEQVASALVRSVQRALRDLDSYEECELHDFSSRVILCSELAELFNRETPAAVLRAYAMYRDSLRSVDQQIRSRTQSSDFFIRGATSSSAGQTSGEGQRELMQRAVRELLAAPPMVPGRKDDLITLLREARFSENSQTMSDAQLYNSLIGLIFASFENTATTATWALWLLAQNPQIQARVRMELADTGLHADGLLASCIDETLRLFSPVWSIGRECVQETKLCGETIPAGHIVFVSPWVQHRHSSFWEQPTTFHPDRFLRTACRNDGRYLPFGLGPQMCVGRMRSLTEIGAFVATILQERHITPIPSRESPEAVFRTIQRPEPGVYVRLTPRSQMTWIGGVVCAEGQADAAS